MAFSFWGFTLSGTQTTALTPRSLLTYAIANPWLPDEAVMTPLLRSWSLRESSLFSAPRILKTLIGWKHSSLRKTSLPRLSEILGENSRGVGGMYFLIRPSAASMSLMVGRGWAVIRTTSRGSRRAPPAWPGGGRAPPPPCLSRRSARRPGRRSAWPCRGRPRPARPP